MNHRKQIIVILLVVCFAQIGCNRQIEPDVRLNANIQTFSNFPEKQAVKFTELAEYLHGVARDIHFADSALIICNMSRTIQAFIYSYDLKNKTFSDGYIKVGRGPNEALSSFASGVTSGFIWMYDGTQSCVLTIDKSSVLNGEQPQFLKTYPISNKYYYKIALVDSVSFIADGDWTSTYKVQHIDLKTNQKLTEYGEFVGAVDSTLIDGIKDVYQAFPYVKPLGDKVLLAYRFSDVIEIYDEGGECIAVQGPQMIALDVKLGSRADYQFFQKDENTVNTFVGGTVTDDYIYLAYSGQTRSDTWTYAKYIYVYDWEGNPIKQLELDRYISALAVSPDNNMLYAFDSLTGYIVEAEL